MTTTTSPVTYQRLLNFIYGNRVTNSPSFSFSDSSHDTSSELDVAEAEAWGYDEITTNEQKINDNRMPHVVCWVCGCYERRCDVLNRKCIQPQNACHNSLRTQTDGQTDTGGGSDDVNGDDITTQPMFTPAHVRAMVIFRSLALRVHVQF